MSTILLPSSVIGRLRHGDESHGWGDRPLEGVHVDYPLIARASQSL